MDRKKVGHDVCYVLAALLTLGSAVAGCEGEERKKVLCSEKQSGVVLIEVERQNHSEGKNSKTSKTKTKNEKQKRITFDKEII